MKKTISVIIILLIGILSVSSISYAATLQATLDITVDKQEVDAGGEYVTFNLKIKCDECEDVKIAKSTAIDDSYIVGDNDNTLKIYYEYYVYNNTFYWYSIMAIVLGVILVPFAKEKHDE